jgi:hypothetical protein
MSRGVKILLVILACIFALGIFSGVSLLIALPRIGKAFVGKATDRANVQRIGAQIGEYRVPEGYRETLALDVLGTRFLTIGRPDWQGMIVVLFQTTEAKLDPKDAERRLNALGAGSAQQGTSCNQFHPTGHETLPVAGKPTVFAISECENAGERRREQVAVFELHGRPTMLMASGPIGRWDEKALRAFSGSLH